MTNREENRSDPPVRKQAISYARCSTVDEESTQTQLIKCITVAREHGHDVLTDPRYVYKDDHVSGASKSRGGLDRLEDDVKQKRIGRNGRDLQVEHLWIRDAARLWRGADPRFPAYFEYLLQTAGISVHYTDTTEQPDYSQGLQDKHVAHFITRAVSTVNAARERVQLTDKFREKKREMVLNRYYPSKSAPYGTERILIDKHTREFIRVIHPGEQIRLKGARPYLRKARDRSSRIVKWIFLSVVAGNSLRGIATELNRRGIPSPAGMTWDVGRISTIVRNRIYVGDLVWGDQKGVAKAKRRAMPPPLLHTQNTAASAAPILYPGFLDDPVVTRDLWDKAQRILDATGSLWSRRRATRPKYLLTGRIRCGECGAIMTGHSIDGQSTTYRYYRHDAGRNGKHQGCSAYMKSVRVEAVEPTILNAIRKLITGEDIQDLVRAHVKRLQADDSAAARRQSADGVKGEIADLESNLAYVTQSEIEAEGSRRVMLASESVRLGRRIDALRADLQRLQEEEERLRTAETRKVTIDTESIAAMLEGRFERKRALVEQLVAEVRYWHSERRIELVLRLLHASEI